MLAGRVATVVSHIILEKLARRYRSIILSGRLEWGVMRKYYYVLRSIYEVYIYGLCFVIYGLFFEGASHEPHNLVCFCLVRQNERTVAFCALFVQLLFRVTFTTFTKLDRMSNRFIFGLKYAIVRICILSEGYSYNHKYTSGTRNRE